MKARPWVQDDRVDATTTATSKKVDITCLARTPAAASAAPRSLLPSANSPTALAIDAASARTQCSYIRTSSTLSRLQSISNATLVSAAIADQQSSKNLDSSEKFSLGDPAGVRANPLAEAGGDEGYKATLELRHFFSPTLRGTLFYDWGEGTINK